MNKTRGSILALAVLCAAGSGGCGGQRAALNQLSLRPANCGPNDVACRTRGMSAPIAVGATFRPKLDMNIPGAGGSAVRFIAAQPHVIEVRGHELTARAPGTTAVLMSTGDTVVDFIHLSTVTTTDVVLHKLGADASELGELRGRVGMIEGETLYLQPAAFGDGQRLAGHADATWKVSSPAVEVLRDGTPHRRRLVARSPGKAEVIVALLGKQTVLHIDVVKAVSR